MIDAAAVSGTATVEADLNAQSIRFTIVPTSATGTGTVTFKPRGTTDHPSAYETVYEEDGTTALTISLSSQISMDIKGPIAGIRVASDNPSDTFGLVVGP